MKTRNTIVLLLMLCFIFLLLSGCVKTIPVPVSETACTTDADCACGTHKDTGACFYGNKEFVNVKRQCPDFCTGIAAMFEIKCVNKECKQVKVTPTPATPDPPVPPATQPECATDSDCVPEQCCHATSCINKEKKGVCNVACTLNCQPGTLDCGGSCTCDSGKCAAHVSNFQGEGSV
jgi:hypothetical protein